MGISYFVVIRRRDENVEKSGTLFRSENLQIEKWSVERSSGMGQSSEPWEIYHLEESGEILG